MVTIVMDVFFREKGYGFATHVDQDGFRTNVFVHIRDVIFGHPIPGSTLECELERNPKGFAAKNIKVVSTGQEAGIAALANTSIQTTMVAGNVDVIKAVI